MNDFVLWLQRQRREMQKPGHRPREIRAMVPALKARNIPGGEKFFRHFQTVTMADRYVAPSALSFLPERSWADAPGFYISRPWRLVELGDSSQELPNHTVFFQWHSRLRYDFGKSNFSFPRGE